MSVGPLIELSNVIDFSRRKSRSTLTTREDHVYPAMMSYDYPHPVSRTYQYKKITKPLLERKRRARINRCLDELKDLMMDALETEGENISKLEKADILELTVRHLQRLQASRPSGLSTASTNDEISAAAAAESRWQSGFGHCAAEACRFLSALPGEAAERLARHLAAGLQTNRQTNSEKTNLLPPTLANLERTANLISPSPGNNASTENGVAACKRMSPKRVTPYSDVRNQEKKYCDATTSTTYSLEPVTNEEEKSEKNCDEKPKKMNRAARSKTREEDEEEIDVERVDDGDPMWRPW